LLLVILINNYSLKIIMEQNNKLVLFEDKPIRRIEHEGETWFNMVDIIAALTDSPSPRNYWAVMKNRLTKEGFETLTICKPLKFDTEDGKKRNMDASNTEGTLRIIMSVPSPKAEPFKQWLAQVGKQSLEESENPELGFERMAELYRAKGHTEEWIKNRLQSIETRKALTDEWKQRGVKEGQEYAILTSVIAKGTFGLSPSEHSELKGLQRQNLRDHMTPLELIFTALGEEITRSETIEADAQGFNENHDVAQKSGQLAGKARALVEKERGKKVVSSENYLNLKAHNDDNKGLSEGDNS
jgi:DNA-damage-inducible protein D